MNREVLPYNGELGGYIGGWRGSPLYLWVGSFTPILLGGEVHPYIGGWGGSPLGLYWCIGSFTPIWVGGEVHPYMGGCGGSLPILVGEEVLLQHWWI